MRAPVAATVALCVALPAAAQQPAPPDTLKPDSARAATLAPVVVRALGSLTAAAAAPWAVTVRERDAADRARAGLALDEPLRAIPGVQVDDRHNWALGERISVRGFGARAQFGVRGVKVLVDGIPATLPDGQTTLNHVDVRLVQRAEVVRGAASSLYGNAAGGVILLETAPPPAAPLEAAAGGVAGSYGLRRSWASVGGGGGAGGWAVHASRLAAEGYRAHASADNRWLLARARREGARGGASLVLTAVDYDAENPGSLSDSLLRVDRRQAYRGNVLQQTGETGRQVQVGASLRRALGAAELEVAPWALHRRIDNPIPGRVVALGRGAGGVRALVRAAERPDGPRAWWSAGVEGGTQHDDRQNYVNESGAHGALVLDQLERVSLAALFGQLGVAPAERLRATAGLRWDRTRFRASDRLASATDPDDSGERTMSALSPAVGASLRIGERAHLYANVATAFETPTTTELANRPSGAGGFNPELEPQRSVSTEAGLRGDLAGALRYEAAVYEAHVRDALIPFEVAGAPGRQFFRNAGRVTHRGAELGAAWSRGELRVEGAYSLTDARFRRYAVAGRSYDGNRLPGVAPHRGELAVGWVRPRGLFAHLEGRAASAMSVDDAGSAQAPGYAVLDLRAGAAGLRAGGAWVTAFAGVANLFDRRYDASVVINAFGRRFHEPAPGRTAFVGLSLGAGRDRSPGAPPD